MRSAPRSRFSSRPGDAALKAGTLQREEGLQVGQAGLGAFVGVHTLWPQTVVTTAGSEVIDRDALVVAPQEPLEGPHRLAAVLPTTGVDRRLDQRLHEGGGVNGLLIALLSRRSSRLICSTPAIAH